MGGQVISALWFRNKQHKKYWNTGKTDALDVNSDLGVTGNLVCHLICDAGVDNMITLSM